MLTCARCGKPVKGKAVETPLGWMHARCASAPLEAESPAEDDVLSSGWKAALYGATLIPYGAWFVVLGSSILYYAWRKEFPNKAKEINRHGWLAWLLGLALWGAIWFLLQN